MSLTLEDVGAVDPRGGHPDDHLVVAGDRVRPLTKCEGFRSSRRQRCGKDHTIRPEFRVIAVTI